MGATPTTGLECSTIQVLEPDGDVPVAVQGGIDPALDERGEVILSDNQSEVNVAFTKAKLSANYRFEYLYVDNLGVAQPGVISAVPVTQTTAGFVVELAGAAIGAGYILRWRVVVVEISFFVTQDVPESFYVNLPQARTFAYYFQSPRTTTDYRFSELRVEYNADPQEDPLAIIPLFATVFLKTTTYFVVLLNNTPNNGRYYLVGKTP